MNRARTLSRRRRLAFTLIELLVVMAIIALLAGLGMPAYTHAMSTTASTKCAANLRAIGVAVSQAAADNNDEYSAIQEAGGPVYPASAGAKDLYDTLSPYGLSTNDLQCPSDMGSGAASAFTQYGSSYEWFPAFDDEVIVNPILYVNGIQIPVNNARVHLCYDFNPVHNGRSNTLYGDGHVRQH